jgi:hypothetical protein
MLHIFGILEVARGVPIGKPYFRCYVGHRCPIVSIDLTYEVLIKICKILKCPIPTAFYSFLKKEHLNEC